MTFALVSQGLRVDDRLIVCRAEFSSDGGDLRYDEQDKQGGLLDQVKASVAGTSQVAGASEVTWIWTGWEPRRAHMTLLLTGSRRAADLRFLHTASRGEVPQQHRIVGDQTGGAFESPVFIETFHWDWPHTPDELEITIVFFEEEPKVTDLVTTPPPPTPAVETEPVPTGIPPEFLLDIEGAEQEFGPQPAP